MITISNTLKIKQLHKKDQTHLLQLMQNIYPPVYKHLWVNEDCNWYLNSQYSKTPFEKDLDTKKANYYFLINNEKPIGILRLIWDCAYDNAKQKKTVKLHRIYIDPAFHGFGFGKQTLEWVIENAKQKKYNSLWLEVMDSQEQALKFYEHIGFKKLFAMRLPFKRIHQSLRGMYTMNLELNDIKKATPL